MMSILDTLLTSIVSNYRSRKNFLVDRPRGDNDGDLLKVSTITSLTGVREELRDVTYLTRRPEKLQTFFTLCE